MTEKPIKELFCGNCINLGVKTAREQFDRGAQAEREKIFDYLYSVPFIRKVDVEFIRKGLEREG